MSKTASGNSLCSRSFYSQITKFYSILQANGGLTCLYEVEGVEKMLKKTLLASLALALAVMVAVPSRAAAAQIGIGVTVGPVFPRPYVVAPVPYAYAVAPPVPYVVAPSPYVALAPGYGYPNYVYPGRVFVGSHWIPRDHDYRYAPRHEYWRR